MKAVVAGNPFRVCEVPEPVAGPGEVVVAFRAGSLNPVDWKLGAGPLRHVVGLRVGAPHIVGSDFAGEVVAVGAGTELSVGDRVVGRCSPFRGQRGSFAERVVARTGETCRLPPEVSFESAACLPVAGVTAWQSLFDLGGLSRGGRVLILGVSGGVGHLAAQLAAAHGLHATGVCSTRNVELARALGCAEVLDYTVVDALLPKDPPYDLVLDAVGTYPARRCRAALRKGGVHVNVLPAVGSLLLSLARGKRTHWVRADVSTESLRPLLADAAQGKLAPRIAARFPLERVGEAVAMSRAGRTVGKILLTP